MRGNYRQSRDFVFLLDCNLLSCRNESWQKPRQAVWETSARDYSCFHARFALLNWSFFNLQECLKFNRQLLVWKPIKWCDHSFCSYQKSKLDVILEFLYWNLKTLIFAKNIAGRCGCKGTEGWRIFSASWWSGNDPQMFTRAGVRASRSADKSRKLCAFSEPWG